MWRPASLIFRAEGGPQIFDRELGGAQGASCQGPLLVQPKVGSRHHSQIWVLGGRKKRVCLSF